MGSLKRECLFVRSGASKGSMEQGEDSASARRTRCVPPQYIGGKYSTFGFCDRAYTRRARKCRVLRSMYNFGGERRQKGFSSAR